MYTEYNFYCDEALHLPNDKSKIRKGLFGILFLKEKKIHRELRYHGGQKFCR